jgi:hypothetical protein
LEGTEKVSSEAGIIYAGWAESFITQNNSSNNMKPTSLLSVTQFINENAPADCRVVFIQSDPSEFTQLEEHSLFVLHPMWAEKGDLL